MDVTTAPAAEISSAARKLARLLLPAGLSLILADVLFWDTSPGINIGIFAVILAVMILVSGWTRLRPRTAVILGLLLASCVQAAIETSFSNGLVTVALTIALAGESFQPHLQTWWARISEVLWGLARSPGRWFLLAADHPTRPPADPRTQQHGLGVYFAVAVWVAGPAFVLLIVFASIFGAGNAVFARGVNSAWEHSLHWLGNLDLSFSRFVFWAFTATLALGVFHGSRAPDAPRWWTFTLPRLRRPDYRLASWQSIAVLLVLNALFLIINTIDAVYLWFANGALPEGVSYSQYVHVGVNSLIAAVLLSALVIAGIFQQEDRVVGGRWMKLLAHVWVAQNLLLIAGTFLRLKLYMDAHHFTEKRIYVGCFLALVTVGFLLLAWFVQRRRTFNWLLGSNAVATFGLFFLLQFANVDGWVAKTNVARWRERWDAAQAAKTPPPWLDVDYLFELGPGAWPALQRLGVDGRDPVVSKDVNSRLTARTEAERGRAETEGWQSWQARRNAARKTIGAFLKTP